MEPLPYHIPDPTWEGFEINSYEEYLSKFLVKSAFHSAVPEDVLKSYKIYEHLAAHAWYSYPSMDDAVAKMLFIAEMAVKQRCEMLGIKISTFKKEKHQNVPLAQLIASLLQHESNKEIDNLLHYIRLLRNGAAHQNRYSFGMGIMYVIKPIVAAINFLFLENAAVNGFILEQQKIQKEINDALNGCLLISDSNGSCIGRKVSVLYSLNIADSWHHAISIEIIHPEFRTHITHNGLASPLCYQASALKINNARMTFWDTVRNQEVSVEVSDNQDLISEYLEYQSALDDYFKETMLGEHRFNGIQDMSKHRLKFDFLYDWLAKVEISTGLGMI